MSSLALGAPPRQPNAAELARRLDSLSVVGNVLYVAAHPDDENTRLLAWLANHAQVRTAYLSLTRGEGGQNLIGAEQAPLLGLIRTQELLAARSVDGGEQMFTRARDFGYSKTAEETLAIWGKDEILSDVVWNIRRFQPDVIVTRFSPDDRETHGHHTASAMLALEAFKLAADPSYHPEQSKWVKPWQAKRIVWNKGVFGPTNQDLSAFLKMDVGGYDPALGASYGEIAATSRSMHKSQGFGAAPQRGPAPEYFKLLAGAPMKTSILDGVDWSWKRVPGADKLQAALAKARAAFNVEHPDAAIPALVEAAQALAAMPENPWKSHTRESLDRLIADCAGLYVDAFAADHVAVPGGDLKVTLTALNRSSAPLQLQKVRLLGADLPSSNVHQTLNREQPWQLEQKVTLPLETPLTNPYWLVDPPEPGRWTVHDQTLIGAPEGPAPVEAELTFSVGGHAFTVTRAITYKWTDPVAGERRRPLEVLPPVTLEPRSPLAMFPDGHEKELRVIVRASAGAATGVVRPQAAEGWTVTPAEQKFSLAQKNDVAEVSFKVKPPANANSSTLRLTAQLNPAGANVQNCVQRVEYPHIPIQTICPPANVKLVRVDVKRAKTHLGYIPGAGDEVPLALRQVGYDVTLLSDEALAHEPLGRFEAIVVGVRAFNTNPRMPQFHSRLMDYVKAGGTLLVQYNTQNRLSKIEGDIGPYPFHISQDRVTDETAPVEMANHPVLKGPNPISERDFAGWIQERGLYFADQWDPHYETPLAMHDPNEPPRKGSLLVARYGKGAFIYTGLAFFRQLPAGVPGAFRLFSNLISYGK